MRCQWQAYLNLLPIWMREAVDKQGKDILQELRLRLHAPPELVTSKGNMRLERRVTRDDLIFCVNTASKYSPWSASTAAYGFLTASGGHRIGLCGEAILTPNGISGIRTPTSLCLRVARDFPGIAMKAAAINGSILIIGRPGSGKTTLLRDLIRLRSERCNGSIAVIDEKGEIFPHIHSEFCFPVGQHTDVLTGCGKPHGIEMVLRNMGPEVIAVDEITAQADCDALIHAGWCGVDLLATAHAGSRQDLFSRPVYRKIIESKLFDTLLILQPDKSWRIERMDI